MSIIFAAIAPHGSLVIDEYNRTDEERARAARTRAAMEELGRRFDAARPEATVLLTPHNVHVTGAFAVITAAAVAGSLEGAATPIAMRCPTDRRLADEVISALNGAGIPAVGVSYGGNDPSAGVMPMDWATQVPLHYMGGRREPAVPVVVIAPARDRSDDEHVRAGAAVARAIDRSGKRVALIASCDHGHAHDPHGPYGFHADAKRYDEQVTALVRADALARLLLLERSLIANAKVDSYWQMLMLHGALGVGWRADLLSYEAPTYFGMLCAAYTPSQPG
jgi:aromatic ring-opening dioxygenase LigB subunit